jgi:hypothetical protein
MFIPSKNTFAKGGKMDGTLHALKRLSFQLAESEK